jgi:hypothetical protein
VKQQQWWWEQTLLLSCHLGMHLLQSRMKYCLQISSSGSRGYCQATHPVALQEVLQVPRDSIMLLLQVSRTGHQASGSTTQQQHCRPSTPL